VLLVELVLQVVAVEVEDPYPSGVEVEVAYQNPKEAEEEEVAFHYQNQVVEVEEEVHSLNMPQVL